MEYLILVLVTLFLIVSASIAFTTGHPKNKKAKTIKNIVCIAIIVCVVIYVTLIRQWVEAIIEYQGRPAPIDHLIAVVPVAFLATTASVAFFIHRNSIRGKIVGVTAFVLLLVGIVVVSLYPIVGKWITTIVL